MKDILTFDIEPEEVQIFLQDVNEHLQDMESALLRLEQQGIEQPGAPDVIGAAFRAAHTLKAVAAAVGHRRMSELTHTVETLFDAMREGLIVPSPVVIDELLASVDTIRTLRDEVVTRNPSGIDVESMIAWLGDLLASTLAESALEVGIPEPAYGDDFPAALALTPEQIAQAQAHLRNGLPLVEVRVVADVKSFAPVARLLQASIALMEVAQVVAQNPAQDNLANAQENGCMWLILATQMEPEAIEARLRNIADLAGFRVQPYELEEAAEAEEFIMPEALSVPGAPAEGPVMPIIQESTVRISVDRLDALMNLVGELVTNRTRLVQIEEVLRAQYGKGELLSALSEMTSDFGRVVEQLQEEVMQARMLPVAQLFNKFPRVVRDVARAAGKDVNFIIEGEATELDRSIIEFIADPLRHLLRNAVDHGLEPSEVRVAVGKSAKGTVRLTAAHEEGHILITVQDDGRGIDPVRIREVAVQRGILSEEESAKLGDDEAIALIFQSNFSTVEQVTQVSGRGVGLDVVRTNVKRLGGTVVVDSEIGQGTTFRLTLPLTLAILQTMLVYIRQDVYAIPLTGIIESLYLEDWKVSGVKGNPVIHWRDQALPLLNLRQFFTHPSANGGAPEGTKQAIVAVAWGKQRVGLVVDGLITKQEIVIKSMSSVIGNVPGISGCAILGDGRVALIMDVPGLISAAMQARRQGETV